MRHILYLLPPIPVHLEDTISTSDPGSIVVDGVNLDDIREFARQFKIRRLSLGLTQTQVGVALSATEGPSYSQSAICRLRKREGCVRVSGVCVRECTTCIEWSTVYTV